MASTRIVNGRRVFYVSGKRVQAGVWRRAGKCPSGKLRYFDAIDAGTQLGKLRELVMVDRLTVRNSYKCDRCKYWHLTSRPTAT